MQRHAKMRLRHPEQVRGRAASALGPASAVIDAQNDEFAVLDGVDDDLGKRLERFLPRSLHRSRPADLRKELEKLDGPRKGSLNALRRPWICG